MIGTPGDVQGRTEAGLFWLLFREGREQEQLVR